MELSELIANLQDKFLKYGDVKCFTNSKHGSVTSIRLTVDEVSIGPAQNELDGETIDYEINNGFLESTQQLIINIGGY